MAQMDTIALLATALANSKREQERRRDRNRQDRAERYGQSMDAISKSVAGVGQGLESYGRIQEQKAAREERLAQELVDRQFKTRADTRAQEAHDYNMGQDERDATFADAINRGDYETAQRTNPSAFLRWKIEDTNTKETKARQDRADAMLADQRAKENARQAQLDASGVVVAGAPEVPGARAEIAAKEGEAQQSLAELAPQHELVQKVEAALPNAQPGIAIQAQRLMQGVEKDAAKTEAAQQSESEMDAFLAEKGYSPAELKAMPVQTKRQLMTTVAQEGFTTVAEAQAQGKNAQLLKAKAVSEALPEDYDRAEVMATPEAQRALAHYEKMAQENPEDILALSSELREALEFFKSQRNAQPNP